MNKSKMDLKIEKINTYDQWDNKETVLIKRLLQYYLPYKIRTKITHKLFSLFVDEEESSFSKKL